MIFKKPNVSLIFFIKAKSGLWKDVRINNACVEDYFHIIDEIGRLAKNIN